VGRESRDRVKGARKRRERRMAQLQMIERAQAENPSVAPSYKMHPPSAAQRRAILRALASRPNPIALVFPHGLPPVNALGPHTGLLDPRIAARLRRAKFGASGLADAALKSLSR
jgi:hypothetical protein